MIRVLTLALFVLGGLAPFASADPYDDATAARSQANAAKTAMTSKKTSAIAYQIAAEEYNDVCDRYSAWGLYLYNQMPEPNFQKLTIDVNNYAADASHGYYQRDDAEYNENLANSKLALAEAWYQQGQYVDAAEKFAEAEYYFLNSEWYWNEMDNAYRLAFEEGVDADAAMDAYGC